MNKCRKCGGKPSLKYLYKANKEGFPTKAYYVQCDDCAIMTSMGKRSSVLDEWNKENGVKETENEKKEIKRNESSGTDVCSRGTIPGSCSTES